MIDLSEIETVEESFVPSRFISTIYLFTLNGKNIYKIAVKGSKLKDFVAIEMKVRNPKIQFVK